MKKTFFLIMLSMMMATGARAQELVTGYNMAVWQNGTCKEYVVTDVDSVTFRPLYGKIIRSITLDKTELEVEAQGGRMLSATLVPEDATVKVLSWASSDETIATVTGSGTSVVVKGVRSGSCVVICWATDGGGAFAQCQVTVKDTRYVDLGLPSGTLWAKWNVGASYQSDYGLYFAWGETEPKTDYSWETYKWSKDYTPGYYNFTKYNQQPEYGYIPPFSSVGYTDGLTELQPEDDAATVLWGEDWQTPSWERFAELFNEGYTTTEREVNGLKVISKANGNSIFLPCASCYHGTELNKDMHRYWTRSLFPEESRLPYVWQIDALAGAEGKADRYRCDGLPIRPVRKQ